MLPEETGVNRRTALRGIVAAAAAGAMSTLSAADSAANKTKAPGRLKQSLCRWTSPAPLPDLCRRLKSMGFAGIDLLYPDEWQVANDNGLPVSMGYPSKREKFIQTGFNDPANHALLLNELETAIPLAKKSAVKNLIAMFGNRSPALNEHKAVENCIAGLSKIAPLAAENGVTICVELLNSKVDHKDYQGDRTAFGVEVVKSVASANVKLLYDIYHMQIMEGDVIRTLRDNLQWIGHLHTGGVPGRHEINETQELYYPAIMKAISDTGFKGYTAQEFIPTGKTTEEKVAALKDAVMRCDV